MGPKAGIEVTTGYSPISFGLGIVKPKLQLDDHGPAEWLWGTDVVMVAPGPHRVRCWFPWGLFKEAGLGTIDVDVPEGALVRVSYKAPNGFVFSKGTFTQGATVPFPAPTPGWHPDPSGRHSLRYWDGTGWTSHVSTNGVASTDAHA